MSSNFRISSKCTAKCRHKYIWTVQKDIVVHIGPNHFLPTNGRKEPRFMLLRNLSPVWGKHQETRLDGSVLSSNFVAFKAATSLKLTNLQPSTFNQISQKQESCKVRFRGKTQPAEIGRKWSGSLELQTKECDVWTLGCESHETNQRINVQAKCKANKRKARRRSSGRGMQSAMANGERWQVRFVEISWNMGLWYALMCFDPVDCVNQNRVDWINVANRPFRIIWHLQNAGWMPTMRHGPHMRRSFLGCVTVCHRAKCALWLQSCGGALVVCRHREINLK